MKHVKYIHFLRVYGTIYPISKRDNIFILLRELIDLFNLTRRVLFSLVTATVLLFALPLAVQANAAITSFIMDRTNISAGQTITATVQTSSGTSHVFAEIGGIRTQGTQISQNTATGIRTWNITLNPPAGAEWVNIYANTSNTIVGGGVVTLTIPITVTGGGTTQPPGTPVGQLDIVEITEITALAANQVRLEIKTGLGATNVWVTHTIQNGEQRFPQAERVSSDATTQTWRVNLTNPSPLLQTVQVSANRAFSVPGATNRNYTIRNTAPFVPPANLLIFNVTANPTFISIGTPSTITVTTNNEVNHVWAMVGNTQVSAVRTNLTSTALRTWTVTVQPTTVGQITIHANTTNTTVGAITYIVPLDVSPTQTAITMASVSWVTPEPATGPQIHVSVRTNRYTRSVWIDIPGIGLREVPRLNTPIGTGDVLWQTEFHVTPAWRTSHANHALFIYASVSETMVGGIQDAMATVSSVGGHWLPGQNQQGLTINPGVRLVPSQVTAALPVLDSLEITTSDDITEIRIHGASGTMTQASFVPGTATGTRVWTLRNVWLTVPANATNVTISLEVRRTTGAWITAPSINIPVW